MPPGFDLIHEIGVAFQDMGDQIDSVTHDIGQFFEDTIIHPLDETFADAGKTIDNIGAEISKDFDALVEMPVMIVDSILEEGPEFLSDIGEGFQGFEGDIFSGITTGLLGGIPLGVILIVLGVAAGGIALIVLLR